MPSINLLDIYRLGCKYLRLSLLSFLVNSAGYSQSCPSTTPATIFVNPSTYYPGLNASLNAGATSINIGAAQTGNTPIAAGDLLLLIQMQGAQINSTNTNAYGSGISGSPTNGYLSNAAMLAGNMEYVVAAGPVAVSGGVLSLQSGIVKNYKNADYGADGQYRFQVIRVALYANLTLGSNISAPIWNGATGGVLVMSVTNTLNFNGMQLSAAGAGFRGGGGRQLRGGTGGSSADFVSLSSQNYHASKGEGIAGTPRFLNNNNALLDNGAANEGYPNGSYAAGAPGNAGGGGTDANPTLNDQNSGGGGGGNGGNGGKGGNSWSSNLPTGGQPAAIFKENSPSLLVMGGGGGAGTSDDGTGSSAAGFSSSGASGGGIILLTAYAITGTGIINANGNRADTTVLNDAGGGGGAGGSVLIYAGSGLSNITVTANGGAGGNNTGTGTPHGPGGGGGGGIIYSNGLLNAASSINAGNPGVTAGAINYGAMPGNNGILVQNVTKDQIPPQALYCSLLPISISSISAAWIQQQVQVNWTVNNETGVKTYTIEKSRDGKNFVPIGIITAANTGTGLKKYSYIDDNLNTGNMPYYYRVKEILENGNSAYSMTIFMSKEHHNNAHILVSPNPVAGDEAVIRVVCNQETHNIRLRLVGLSGAAVWEKNYTATAGENFLQINHTGSLPNGYYFLQYSDGKTTATQKIIINH